MLNSKRIILGTAQFSGIYGISNNKKLSSKQIEKIIKYSYKIGINLIEVSSSYGKSQETILKIIKKNSLNKKLGIIYKFNNLNNKVLKYLEIINKNFKLKCIFAHSAKFFLTEKFQQISKKYSHKKVSIGVSVYEKKEINKLLRHKNPPSIIQVPFNIFNTSFNNKELQSKLNLKKIKIHVRSIFNQGLIFLDDKKIKYKFPNEYNNFISLKKKAKDFNENLLTLSLKLIFSKKKFKKILIGVISSRQIGSILSININKKLDNNLVKFIESFKFKNKIITDPRKWKKV